MASTSTDEEPPRKRRAAAVAAQKKLETHWRKKIMKDITEDDII